MRGKKKVLFESFSPFSFHDKVQGWPLVHLTSYYVSCGKHSLKNLFIDTNDAACSTQLTATLCPDTGKAVWCRNSPWEGRGKARERAPGGEKGIDKGREAEGYVCYQNWVFPYPKDRVLREASSIAPLCPFLGTIIVRALLMTLWKLFIFVYTNPFWGSLRLAVEVKRESRSLRTDGPEAS